MNLRDRRWFLLVAVMAGLGIGYIVTQDSPLSWMAFPLLMLVAIVLYLVLRNSRKPNA